MGLVLLWIPDADTAYHVPAKAYLNTEAEGTDEFSYGPLLLYGPLLDGGEVCSMGPYSVYGV